jgi:hypothetical protein
LVVANQTLLEPRLRAFAAELSSRQPCSFHLLVPATRPSPETLHGMRVEGIHPRQEEAPGLALARHRLRIALAEWTAAGLDADGEVGDPDALIAVQDATRDEAYDLIIVSTLPRRLSAWLRRELPTRLLGVTKVPLLHLEASEARVSAAALDTPER